MMGPRRNHNRGGQRHARSAQDAGPTPISALVEGALRRHGLSDQARRFRIQTMWARAVGPEIASRTAPGTFSRGILVVTTPSAAWRNELTFLKRTLITKLNEALGEPMVRDIRARCGSPDEADDAGTRGRGGAGRRRCSGAGGAGAASVGSDDDQAQVPDEQPLWAMEPATNDDHRAARDFSQPIEDEELKESFERLVERCRRAQRALARVEH